jgi:bifunctional DNA-binding transcriptional regulator/antitoxin component of YhaV-PrlF toxin-antitoxin module
VKILANLIAVKQIDSQSRFKIPKNFLELNNWKDGDYVEILADSDGEELIIRKSKCFNKCKICNSKKGLTEVDDILVCDKCMDKLVNAIKEGRR